MGVEFDIERVYGNISKLMKDQEIKVSEMETVMDVSTGYFSKLVKNKTVLGADVLFRIAQRLGVTVDLLINCDLTVDRATDNLRLMTSFLQKLRADTDATRLRWNATNAESLEFDYILSSNEPSIFTSIEFKKNPLDGKIGYYENVFQPSPIEIVGQGFYVDMGGTRVFMSRLVETATEGSHAGEEITYYAIDSCDSSNTRQMCSSKDNPELLSELELLYECLKRHAADLQISEPVRSFIDAYVNPPKPTLGQTIGALQRELRSE